MELKNYVTALKTLKKIHFPKLKLFPPKLILKRSPQNPFRINFECEKNFIL